MENIMPTGQPSISPKHSGLGIASFIISVVMSLYFFILTGYAGVLEVTTPGGLPETSPQAVVIGLCLFFGLIICIIGIGLGIAALLQKGRRKVFSVLGLAINAAVVLGVIALVAAGQSAG